MKRFLTLILVLVATPVADADLIIETPAGSAKSCCRTMPLDRSHDAAYHSQTQGSPAQGTERLYVQLHGAATL